LRDLTNIDSILTVVDAEAFDEEHFQSEAALKQITYGDIILLNKTDLVTPEKIQEVENFIHDIKRGAKILHTQYGEVALPLILDVGLTPKDKYIAIDDEDQHKHEHHHHHEHEHHHHHSDHLDNDGFVSISFRGTFIFLIKLYIYIWHSHLNTWLYKIRVYIHLKIYVWINNRLFFYFKINSK
jgi:G3E family GTPase